MITFAIAYLLIGLPFLLAGCFIPVPRYSKSKLWINNVLVMWPLWPLWIGVLIYWLVTGHYSICAHCKSLFKPSEIYDHVLKCESNPLVQEITRLKSELREKTA